MLSVHIKGATIVAGTGEAGLRAAIAAAQEGDIVLLTTGVKLEGTVPVDKGLTIRFNQPNEWYNAIHGDFDGALLHLAADGIILENLTLSGSPLTDALRLQTNALLRDCAIRYCRRPLAGADWYTPLFTLRLERVTVTHNQDGVTCWNLEAKDSTFSFNQGYAGAAAYTGNIEGCRFENNHGNGLSLNYGTVKNCVFRFNSETGFYTEPDPGMLAFSGCLFYANAAGGVHLGEQLSATMDNCTFTRHTGWPAVMVREADVLFRHCTVADNVVHGDPGAWPPRGGAFMNHFGRMELQNCIVADNPTNDSPYAAGLGGPWIDGGGNVIGGPAGLGFLRDNGGPTFSLLPLPGSPAIDAGEPTDLLRDARGLSRVAGAAPDAGAIEANAGPVADADGDGLPDVWEQARALDPSNPADASSDTDGDGQNALAEFKSGTEPSDGQSFLRFEELIVPPTPLLQPFPRHVYLLWSYVPGVRYTIETSTDLRQWSKLPLSGEPYDRKDGRLRLVYIIEARALKAFYRVVAESQNN